MGYYRMQLATITRPDAIAQHSLPSRRQRRGACYFLVELDNVGPPQSQALEQVLPMTGLPCPLFTFRCHFCSSSPKLREMRIACRYQHSCCFRGKSFGKSMKLDLHTIMYCVPTLLADTVLQRRPRAASTASSASSRLQVGV